MYSLDRDGAEWETAGQISVMLNLYLFKCYQVFLAQKYSNLKGFNYMNLDAELCPANAQEDYN